MRDIVSIVAGLAFLLLIGCNSLNDDIGAKPTSLTAISTSIFTRTPRSAVNELPTQLPTPINSPISSSPEASESVETNTPTPLQNSNLMAQKIMSDHIINFYWTSDSRKLIFETPGQFWQFELATNQLKKLGNNELVALTPIPNLELSLPETADNISFAPSGSSYIYLNSIEPTKTPSLHLGEQYLRGELAELWLNQNGNSTFITELNNCFIGTTWSKNEKRLILFPDIHANCIDADGVYVNLESGETQLLFPDEEFPHYILLRDFSLDGKRILWSEKIDDKWRVWDLNVETGRSNNVDIPQGILNELLNVRWIINFDNLLISYYENGDHVMNIYNLKTDELYPILSSQVLNESGAIGELSRGSLSPNQQWFTFITDKNFEIEGLWLIPIDYP